MYFIQLMIDWSLDNADFHKRYFDIRYCKSVVLSCFEIWHAMVFDMASWEIIEWHGELYWNASVANRSHIFIMRWTFVFSVRIPKFRRLNAYTQKIRHGSNCHEIALSLATKTMLWVGIFKFIESIKYTLYKNHRIHSI